jgi:hypothetical protein
VKIYLVEHFPKHPPYTPGTFCIHVNKAHCNKNYLFTSTFHDPLIGRPAMNACIQAQTFSTLWKWKRLV